MRWWIWYSKINGSSEEEKVDEGEEEYMNMAIPTIKVLDILHQTDEFY